MSGVGCRVTGVGCRVTGCRVSGDGNFGVLSGIWQVIGGRFAGRGGAPGWCAGEGHGAYMTCGWCGDSLGADFPGPQSDPQGDLVGHQVGFRAVRA